MIRTIKPHSCLILLISLLFCMATAFPAHAKKRNSDKKIKTKITKITKYEAKLLEKKLSHPANFKVEGIEKALKPVKYREKALTEGKKKLIFRGKTINQLALLIHKALLKIKPESKVSFSVPTSGGKTTGDVFATKNALIFKFETINGNPYLDDLESEAEAGVEPAAKADMLSNWLLVPGKGQKLYSYEGSLGWQVKERTMIVTNLGKYKGKEKTVTAVVEKDGNKDTKSYDKKKTIEDKLRLLKDLKKKNLISNDAYEKKVQKLLDQL